MEWICRPQSIGYQAKQLIAQNDAFEVHSIFEKAVNLIRNQRIITLTNREMMRHPYVLVLSDLGHHIALQQGDKVRLHIMESEWPAEGGQHTTERSYSWNPELMLPVIQRWLIKHKWNETAANYQIGSSLESLLVEARSMLNSQSVCISSLNGIIGNGPGLTPTGDDVIVGMLAWFQHRPQLVANPINETLLRFIRIFRESVAAVSVEETHELSRMIIQYALEGDFLDVLQTCCFAAGKGTLSNLEMNRLLQVGSSSGRDMLAGVYWAMLIQSEFEGYNRYSTRRYPCKMNRQTIVRNRCNCGSCSQIH